jgi:hypothetical protein
MPILGVDEPLLGAEVTYEPGGAYENDQQSDGIGIGDRVDCPSSEHHRLGAKPTLRHGPGQPATTAHGSQRVERAGQDQNLQRHRGSSGKRPATAAIDQSPCSRKLRHRRTKRRPRPRR